MNVRKNIGEAVAELRRASPASSVLPAGGALGVASSIEKASTRVMIVLDGCPCDP